ncbi:hypothetical protein R6Y99_10130 [Pseudomonas lundensis]|uniref:hypothetical protein n=1 Tax=Serratia proteamaculans TaxID=28151 RepID=UPI002981C804|nr:hypothetical protein [Serratia proteamaculans]MDW5500145.1 hypothetical protein [Serratia proteamaculans]MDW5505211.1 hypothetical protein [Pseudomonas lundensis]
MKSNAKRFAVLATLAGGLVSISTQMLPSKIPVAVDNAVSSVTAEGSGVGTQKVVDKIGKKSEGKNEYAFN